MPRAQSSRKHSKMEGNGQCKENWEWEKKEVSAMFKAIKAVLVAVGVCRCTRGPSRGTGGKHRFAQALTLFSCYRSLTYFFLSVGDNKTSAQSITNGGGYNR